MLKGGRVLGPGSWLLALGKTYAENRELTTENSRVDKAWLAALDEMCAPQEVFQWRNP